MGALLPLLIALLGACPSSCPSSSDRAGTCAPWDGLAPPLQGADVEVCTATALAVTYPGARPAEVRSRWEAWAATGWRPVDGAELTWLGEGQSLSLTVEGDGEGAMVSAVLAPTR